MSIIESYWYVDGGLDLLMEDWLCLAEEVFGFVYENVVEYFAVGIHVSVIKAFIYYFIMFYLRPDNSQIIAI